MLPNRRRGTQLITRRVLPYELACLQSIGEQFTPFAGDEHHILDEICAGRHGLPDIRFP